MHLSLYHTIPTFDHPWQERLLKTLWKKEKMLVISIFSFSHNVFQCLINTKGTVLLHRPVKLGKNPVNSFRLSFLLWSSVRPPTRPWVSEWVSEQLLKNSSPLKPPNRFQWNFTEMILRWCTFKILQKFEFHGELWLPWQPREKTLKIFLSQTVRARALIFCM